MFVFEKFYCLSDYELLHDSYLNEKDGWPPGKGVRLPNGDPIVTIRDFLRFAGVAV